MGAKFSGPVIVVEELTKTFNSQHALRDVNLTFESGTVHALFGENGAGKSTLINILAGVLAPTGGKVWIAGTDCTNVTPREARSAGIAAVFQEPALVPQLTVAENLRLGREVTRMGLVQRGQSLLEAQKQLQRIGPWIPADHLVSDLSRAEQQIVEIARGLGEAARVLILDEPTAALADQETDRLFRIVEQLRTEGLCIIYITHRLREIRRIADTVSILRDGQLVDTRAVTSVTDDELVALMAGRKIEQLFPAISATPAEVMLEFDGACSRILRNVSLTVRRGELVGVAGLVGSGKDEIGRVAFGLSTLTKGAIRVRQSCLTGSERIRPRDQLRNGMMYYPADRKANALVGCLSARENVTLSATDRFTRSGLVDRQDERETVNRALSRLNLRPLRPEALPGTFSGGNQQKVVLARGFVAEYDIHIFDEPTAGVDVGARVEIYQFIANLVEGGAAVLLISSDLPEVLNLCSRAYVVSNGQVTAELRGESLTEAAVLAHFFNEHEEQS